MTANYVIHQRTGDDLAASGPKRCLCCRGQFASGGRHEWVCPRCKDSDAWQAALSEYACYPEAQPRGGAE